MYSYQIELEENPQDKILRVGFNRIVPASGDRIVRDAWERLQQMLDSGELQTGGVLKIDGPQSVPVAYTIAHKLAHLYEAIAILDPKIGKKGYKTYIVTITHGSSQYQIGELIETKEPQAERTKIKLALCGPPQSGKSCLRDGLKRAILGILDAPYPYIITACPDGEGSWHHESYGKNQELAKINKIAHKSELNSEFAQEAAQWIRSANQLINIIDVGGKISPENEIIMKEATHAAIVSQDPSMFKEWENFCRSLNLKIVAEIHSQLEEGDDSVILLDSWQENTLEKLNRGPILTGSVRGLNRGEKDLSERPMVRALATLLNHLTKY